MKTDYVAQVSVSPTTGGMTFVLDGYALSGLAVLLAGGLAALRFVLNRAINQVDKKFEEMSDRLKKIEDVEISIQEFKTEAARQYVTRDEWVRAVTVSDAKLDAVHRRLDQISDRILMILTGRSNEQ